MKRLSLLLVLPLLAACTAPPGRPASPILDIFRERQPEVPAPLPPQVLAALPAGVPPSVVTRNVDGCYILTLEVTVPPSGYPLRDAAGNIICDGSPVAVASAAPLAAPGLSMPTPAAAAPVSIAPISTSPVSTARLDQPPVFVPGGPPVPTAILGAPPPPAPAGAGGPLVPGDITPPAPIAPLNPT